MHLLQAQSSSLKSQSPDNEIELMTKRIRTAELATLSKEEKSYIKASAGVDTKNLLILLLLFFLLMLLQLFHPNVHDLYECDFSFKIFTPSIREGLHDIFLG